MKSLFCLRHHKLMVKNVAIQDGEYLINTNALWIAQISYCRKLKGLLVTKIIEFTVFLLVEDFGKHSKIVNTDTCLLITMPV